MPTTSEIISDEEIERVHAKAVFTKTRIKHRIKI